MLRRWSQQPSRRHRQYGRLYYSYARIAVVARKLISDGVIGDVTWFRGEHTEDFLADPKAPATWRTDGWRRTI
jgi:hypothetical protein